MKDNTRVKITEKMQLPFTFIIVDFVGVNFEISQGVRNKCINQMKQ
jgi:hypothetical protein